MKKVLIITTHFPPDRHVGGHRPSKFSKYLPQFGWQSVVLTIPVNEIVDGIDITLANDLSKDLKIHRIPGWRCAWESYTKHNATDQNRFSKVLRKIKWIKAKIGGLILPHYKLRWIVNSIKEGMKIVDKEKIDLLFLYNVGFLLHH